MFLASFPVVVKYRSVDNPVTHGLSDMHQNFSGQEAKEIREETTKLQNRREITKTTKFVSRFNKNNSFIYYGKRGYKHYENGNYLELLTLTRSSY